VHKNPYKPLKEGMSRSLFKKKKPPLSTFTLVLLFLLVVAALFLFLDGAALHRLIEALLS